MSGITALYSASRRFAQRQKRPILRALKILALIVLAVLLIPYVLTPFYRTGHPVSTLSDSNLPSRASVSSAVLSSRFEKSWAVPVIPLRLQIKFGRTILYATGYVNRRQGAPAS